jgi:hypothetical protein
MGLELEPAASKRRPIPLRMSGDPGETGEGRQLGAIKTSFHHAANILGNFGIRPPGSRPVTQAWAKSGMTCSYTEAGTVDAS